MSEPPYGDNRLETWAGECPQEICLMGNIDQISFLKQAAPAEVTRRAEEALRIMAVSYTHLDVYKRQPSRRLACFQP